jgi:hypothetical protein
LNFCFHIIKPLSSYGLWLNHETLGNTKLHFQVLASLPNSVTKSYQSW